MKGIDSQVYSIRETENLTQKACQELLWVHSGSKITVVFKVTEMVEHTAHNLVFLFLTFHIS